MKSNKNHENFNTTAGSNSADDSDSTADGSSGSSDMKAKRHKDDKQQHDEKPSSSASSSTSSNSSTSPSTTLNSNSPNLGSNNNGSAGLATGSIEEEYNRIHDRTGWHRLYQEIREKSEREAHEKHFGTDESDKSKNRSLNRYRDVNPYDHSRIKLQRGNVDYINANLVKLERAGRKYILTQGPLPDTVGHFWLMVWEQNSRAILMLNKLMEKKQVKCHKYWPDRCGAAEALKLNELKLIVEYVRCEQYKNFSCRWFNLKDVESQQSREIIQFHYTTWPDFGIPSSPVAFLQFLKQVRDSGALNADVGPAIVHCSAGIGRSGTFCLVDCCLVLFEKEGEDKVSVQDVLYELRRYRMGLIQTADQLYFSYQAIIEGIKLLKDPTFLDYHETPKIISDEGNSEGTETENNEIRRCAGGQYQTEETPPPLPPRTYSLMPAVTPGSDSVISSVTAAVCKMTNKPLPLPPNSENANELLIAAESTPDHHKHENKNLKSIESHASHDVLTNRPLPPLPNQKHEQRTLERVHESDSDEDTFLDDDDDDEDDYDDLSDVDYENGAETDESKQDDHVHFKNGSENGLPESRDNDVKKHKENAVTRMLNGINNESVSQSPAASMSSELRRRKRAERQANLEKKIKEIKQKQRQAELEAEASNKPRGLFPMRRRSLAACLAACVLVGAICAYAYTKMD